MNTKYSRLILAMVVLCSCVGCDQATKRIAINSLRDQSPQSFLADTLRLDLEENPGGFLSLGASLPDSVRTPLFIGSNCILLFGLSAFLIFKRNIPIMLFISLVCVLAGGIGNLFDRLINNGLVTDFINVGVGPIRTGIFNVADVAITFGAIVAFFVSVQRQSDVSAQSPPSASEGDN